MKKIRKAMAQWLEFVGKDKLQTFQDNFAKAYGVSMVFLDMNGQPLTVGSQNSMFCFTLGKKHAASCAENFQADRESMQKAEAFIHVCPFGITCLYVPVFFNDRPIAFAAVGGLTYESSDVHAALIDRFHIRGYSKEKVQEIMSLLQSMIRLLNFNLMESNDKAQNKEPPLPLLMKEDHISRREYEIIRLLCKGYSNKQIGRELYISDTTVKTHINNILTKLNLHGRMQIVARYYTLNEMIEELHGNTAGEKK